MQNISVSILSNNACASSFWAAAQILQNLLIIFMQYVVNLHCLKYGQMKILHGEIEE